MKEEIKIKKKKRKILNLLLLLLGASTGYFIYSILLLDGIEDMLRYLFVALLVIVFIIYTLTSLTIRTKGKFKNIFFYISIILLIVGQLVVGNYISKFYTTLGKMSKDTEVYSSSLVTLTSKNIDDNNIKNIKIGMINDTSSIDGYTISKEIISDKKLTTGNTITEYEDYFSMLNDLYASKIDAVFLPSDYVGMFQTTTDFANIKNETKVIVSKDKEVKKKKSTTSTKNLTEPFTVLIMGIDSITSDIKNANSNGDSLMVVSFNPKTLNATILSIPRDTYVPISCFANQKKNKITHAGWYGETCMEETIENFTGIEIDYYVKVDFKGVVDLVEILDGITVNVPMNFCEQDSARSFKNQICLKTGMQTLNGEAALALARHRHSLATGDLQRGINQQIVVEGILSQIKNVKNVNQLYDILTAIEKHMDTNISTSQILSLYNVAKDIASSGTSSTSSVVSMQQLYLEGESARIYDTSFKKELYNYVYYKKSLAAISDAVKINLGLKDSVPVKTFTFSINSVYEKEIIGKGLSGASSLDLVPSFTGKTKAEVQSWANARNIKVTYNYVDKDDSYTQDDVVSQSVPIKSDSSTITSMTITLANIKVVEAPVLKEYYLKSDPTKKKTITIEKYKSLPVKDDKDPEEDENDQTDYSPVYE